MIAQTASLTIFLLLTSVALNAQGIYKHVDERGHVTYSNAPIKGGKKVDLPPLSTAALPKVPAPKAPAPVAEADKALQKKQLQEAIANTEKELATAKIKAKEGDVPEYTHSTKAATDKNGKPTTITEIRENPSAYQEKMKKLNAEVAAQEKKLADLKTELGRLDAKP